MLGPRGVLVLKHIYIYIYSFVMYNMYIIVNIYIYLYSQYIRIYTYICINLFFLKQQIYEFQCVFSCIFLKKHLDVVFEEAKLGRKLLGLPAWPAFYVSSVSAP